MQTTKTRWRRAAIATLLAAGTAAGGVTLLASPANASAMYHVIDADHDPYNGIYLRNSTGNFADATRTGNRYITYGTAVEDICGAWGVSVGQDGDPNKPHYNRRWHKIRIPNGEVGWMPDRYMDTPNVANQLTPGEPECSDIVVASAPKPHTVINGMDVGYPQNGKHRWGNCTVQDFKGGPHDWVIVGYDHGTQIVRNGMLWGWFDNGGAPGMGCPQNQEYGYANGVRQDFDGGSLLWVAGMDHAIRIDGSAPVRWALDCAARAGGNNPCYTYNQNGQRVNNYALWCLAFVVDSYRKNGVTPNGPSGWNASAYMWWDNIPAARRHAGDTNAPAGMFVVWGREVGADGHIALSIGHGWAVSTQFHGSGPRVIRIADYPGGYRGWVTPN